MAGIFISYRREDSIAYAGRLYDRLQAHFGDEQVFMDIDTLQPGEGFVVAGCIAIADHVPKHSRALLTRYFSYSHRDKKWLERLQIHLPRSCRKERSQFGRILRFVLGQEWKSEIESAMEFPVLTPFRGSPLTRWMAAATANRVSSSSGIRASRP